MTGYPDGAAAVATGEEGWLEVVPRLVDEVEVGAPPDGEEYCACCELLFEDAPLPLGLLDGRRVDDGDAFAEG